MNYQNLSQLDRQKKLNSAGHFSTASGLFYLDNVSVEYGDLKALKSVQLTIEKGEILFITGSSGAGKSTLLKILSGDILPHSGRMIGPHQDKNHFVAEVFQDLRLISNLSCLENLNLSYDPNIYRNRSEFNQDLKELAKVLGILDRLDLKISDANGGLGQKIAIMRALLSRPTVLLADEPTSSLDYESTKKIFDVLSVYNIKRGLTVVWASHNREIVKKFSGRIIHLDNGKLIYSGHACFI